MLEFLQTIKYQIFKKLQVLSISQIYRIGTMFWDDKYGAQGLSQEVNKFLVEQTSISMYGSMKACKSKQK